MAKKVSGFEASLVYDNFNHPLFKTITTLQDGNVINKTLSLGDFLKLFRVSIKEESSKYVSVPTPPNYYYKGGIGGRPDTFWISLYVPPARRQYICDQTKEFFNLPFPGLFFVLKVSKGTAQEKYCFAIADDVISDNSVLMNYPYGHVAIGGNICMGSCSANVSSFSHADEFVDSFFLGRDAGHYYEPGKLAKPQVPLRQLVGMVDKKGVFPTEWLVPYESKGQYVTVKSFLDRFQKTTKRM